MPRAPSLSLAEQLELGRLARAGDRAAADKLVRSVLPYARKIAGQYHAPGVDLDDLVAEAYLGAAEAIPRYEPERGLRFLTYASQWIRCRLRGAVVRARLASKEDNFVRNQFFKVRKQHGALLADLGDSHAAFDALVERFAKGKPKSRAKVEEAIRFILASDVSLDRSMDDDGGGSFVEGTAGSTPTPEEAVLEKEAIEASRSVAKQLLSRLPDKQREIIRRRLMQHPDDVATLKEIGDERGVSREWIRQSEAAAMKKLRKAAQ